MDGELLFVFSMLILWIVLGGVALRFSANTYFKKNATIKRAIAAQSLMVVVLPFWTEVYMARFGDIFSFPYKRFYPLLILICCLIQVLIIKKAFHLNWFQGSASWLISLLPTYFVFQLAMPSHVLFGGARSLGTKANGEMRAISGELSEYLKSNGELPLPVAENGMEIEPTRSSNQNSALYFQGPSFVPASITQEIYEDRKPYDPFRLEDKGPYGYGAGPIRGATAAFILTSRGPDLESQAEELEYLYLDKLRGDDERFKNDPECLNLIYSPTNGTVSPGDLCRGHRNSKIR